MTKDFAAAYMALESDICELVRLAELALIADDADDADGQYSLAALSIELFAKAAHELDQKWHDLHRGVVGEKQQRRFAGGGRSGGQIPQREPGLDLDARLVKL